MFKWKKKNAQDEKPQAAPAGATPVGAAPMGNQPPPNRPSQNQSGQNQRGPGPNRQGVGQRPINPQNPGQPQPNPQQPAQPYHVSRPKYQSVSGVNVMFDHMSVRCTKPDGPPESVRWDELAGVFIMTEVEGKYSKDMFWILAGKERGGIVFPNTAAGAAEIIRYMQDHLRGFDNKAIIDAMDSKESKKFLIWKSGR